MLFMILKAISSEDHENGRPVHTKRISGKYYNMSCAVLRMSITTSVMGGNWHMRTKQDTGSGIPRPLKYMAVQTAAVVNIRQNVCHKYDAEKHSDQTKVMKIERWEKES